jgi:hypothetical protein
MYDRRLARRFGRRLQAFVHGLAGAAVAVVVLRVFSGVSLWWLVLLAMLLIGAILSSGLYAAWLLRRGE